MQIQISFKHPKRGFYKMYLSGNERLQVVKGRAKRVPVDKKSLLNSIPVQYISSVKMKEMKLSQCPVCKEGKKSLICFECIQKIAKSTSTPNQHQISL